MNNKEDLQSQAEQTNNNLQLKMQIAEREILQIDRKMNLIQIKIHIEYISFHARIIV